MCIWNTLKSLHRNIYGVAIVGFLMQFGASIVYTSGNALIEGVLLSPSNLIALRSFAEAISQFAKVISGYLSDLLQNRKLFLLLGYGSMILFKIFFFITGLDHIFPVLFLATLYVVTQVLDRVMNAIRDAPRDALILDSCSSNQGTAFAVRKSIAALGTVSAGIFTYFCLQYNWFSRNTLFFIAIWPVALATIILYFMVKNIHEEVKIKTGTWKSKLNIIPQLIFTVFHIIKFLSCSLPFGVLMSVISLYIQNRMFILFYILMIATSILADSAFLSPTVTFLLICMHLLYNIWHLMETRKTENMLAHGYAIGHLLFLFVPLILLSAANWGLCALILFRIQLFLLPHLPKMTMDLILGSASLYITDIYSLIFFLLNRGNSLLGIFSCHLFMFTATYFNNSYILILGLLPNLLMNNNSIQSITSASIKLAISAFLALPSLLYGSIMHYGICSFIILWILNKIQETELYNILTKESINLERFWLILILVGFATIGRVNDTVFFKLAQNNGLTARDVPIIFSSLYAVISISSLFVSRLVNNRWLTSFFLFFFLIFANFLVSCDGGIIIFFLSIICLGIYTSISDVFLTTMVSETIPKPELRGTLLGIFFTLQGVISFINASLTTGLLSYWSLNVIVRSWIAIPLCATIVIPAILFALPRIREPQICEKNG